MKSLFPEIPIEIGTRRAPGDWRLPRRSSARDCPLDGYVRKMSTRNHRQRRTWWGFSIACRWQRALRSHAQAVRRPPNVRTATFASSRTIGERQPAPREVFLSPFSLNSSFAIS